MRYGLEVWSADYRRVVDTCVRAEALGFDAFYYGESPTGLNLDCWTMLAALAEATERIRIGPVMTNILGQYRSVALLGKQAATVAVIAGGRLDFRTGAGADTAYGRAWWRPFGVDYGGHGERADALDRAMQLLRPFWAGAPVSFDGDQQAVLGFDCPPIPVTISATGDRGLTLAANHGDIWESSFRTAEEFRTLDARFESLAVAGRRCRAVRSLEIDAVVGTTPRRAGATLETFRSQRGDEDLEPPLARALVGTPPEVAAQVTALANVGVDQLVIAAHDPLDVDALEALAAAATLHQGQKDRPVGAVGPGAPTTADSAEQC